MRVKAMFASTAARIVLLVVLGLLAQGIIYVGYFGFSLSNLAERQSTEYRDQAIVEEKGNLMDTVGLAWRVVDTYYRRSTDVEALKRERERSLRTVVDAVTSQVRTYLKDHPGQPAEERNRAVTALVRGLRFDDGNYVWINDMTPRMVMHPANPKLDGQDLRDFKDSQGTALFVDMVEVCREHGAGVVDYLWVKPGETEPKLKISYVKLVPELGWVFGSGAWVEDITAEMKAQALAQLSGMRMADGNYFWVNDDTRPVPVMLMHPTDPGLVGHPANDASFDVATSRQAGPDGKVVALDGKVNLFSALVEAASDSEKGGFVTYTWNKPLPDGGVTQQRFPKLGYMRAFKPWGWMVGMGVYVDRIDARASTFHDQTRHANNEVALHAAVVGGAVLLLTLGLSVWILRRSLTRPLKLLIGYFNRVAAGDLDTELAERFSGEMGELKENMGVMVAALKEKMHETEGMLAATEQEKQRALEARREAEDASRRAVRAKREGMLEAAGSLEGIVEDLSAAAGELGLKVGEVGSAMSVQNDRTGQTASAMEQMNATALEVARNAGSASEAAGTTRSIAAEGEAVAHSSVGSMDQVRQLTVRLKADMNELGGQVESIGRIMAVINDIADQTNLLALNAAIEAARAGDAGRGFAVVADEVRKLAEKTMQATKEVEEAVTKVQQGARRNVEGVDQAAAAVDEATGLVNESGEALRRIAEHVQTVTDQISSIATAAEEQSATSDEINQAVEDISRIASETSQGMSEAQRVLGDLGSLTGKLKEMVDGMRRGDGDDES